MEANYEQLVSVNCHNNCRSFINQPIILFTMQLIFSVKKYTRSISKKWGQLNRMETKEQSAGKSKYWCKCGGFIC